MAESVHTHLMFQNGRAQEALRYYEELFEGDFTVDELDTYGEDAPGPTGQVQLAICTFLGQRITCIDSPSSTVKVPKLLLIASILMMGAVIVPLDRPCRFSRRWEV